MRDSTCILSIEVFSAIDILEHIKQLRDERGWSNYRLAKRAQIAEGTLNNLFRLNNLPTIPTLEALCKGFGITLSQFFASNGEALVLNEEQQEMLNAWNTLTKEQKNALLELLKQI
ncbi:MAG: helix-turn-helix domain-containing protein [Oscillospiraceae bacterium]|nr:helix-turn-helix domain-containing protein [Oscillospiraceae bacterium]